MLNLNDRAAIARAEISVNAAQVLADINAHAAVIRLTEAFQLILPVLNRMVATAEEEDPS